MVIRVIRAHVQSGRRLEYVQLSKSVTTLHMRMYPEYLEYRDCAAHEKTPDIVVSATLWRNEAAIQAFTLDQVNSGDWRAVAILPWEQEIVTRAEVVYFDDDYPSLMDMWNQHRTIVRQRRAATGFPPLNDEQWGKVEPILNPVIARPRRGRPPRDSRPIYGAVLDVIATGSFWNNVPQGIAPATAWRRYQRWRAGDAWNEAWRLLLLALEPARAQKLVLDFLDCSHHPRERPPRKSATLDS